MVLEPASELVTQQLLRVIPLELLHVLSSDPHHEVIQCVCVCVCVCGVRACVCVNGRGCAYAVRMCWCVSCLYIHVHMSYMLPVDMCTFMHLKESLVDTHHITCVHRTGQYGCP